MIYPVILSVGSGTRLWPMSRSLYPKQLLALFGDTSLLQETVSRIVGKPEVALRPRVRRLRYLRAARGFICGLLPSGHRQQPAGLVYWTWSDLDSWDALW